MIYEELYHVGVLGMKWGIRRSRSKLSALKEAANKQQSPVKSTEIKNEIKKTQKKLGKQESALKTKLDKKVPSYKKMSDDELQSRIKRLNMEKQYVQLTGEGVSKGKKALNSALEVLKTINSIDNATTSVVKASLKVASKLPSASYFDPSVKK